jgi:hypothetical protein
MKMVSNSIGSEKTALLLKESELQESDETQLRFRKRPTRAVKGLVIVVLLFGW